MDQSRYPFKVGDKVLECGGGTLPCHRPNCDIRWGPNIDYPGIDLAYPLPFKDESFDGLHLRHSLEHISFHQVPLLLKECHRLLRPGGIAVIETPNLVERCRLAIQWLQEGQERLANEALFGSQEFGQQWDTGAHHSGYGTESITRLLKEAGFYAVEARPIETDKGPADMMIIARKSRAKVERL